MGRGSKVRYTKCKRKDTVVRERIPEEKRRNILCLEYRTEEKKPWWNWGMAVQPIEAKAQQSSM